MSLEDAFYVLAIVVMSINLIILIVIVGAVLVIRNKVVHIQESIEDKLSLASAAANVAKKVINKR